VLLKRKKVFEKFKIENKTKEGDAK